MQAKAKSAFLLLAVLALGIVIGSLVSGAIQNRRLSRIAEMRTGRGMAHSIARAVEPLTAEQRARVQAVLDSAAPRFAEVFERNREETRVIMDSVMEELSTFLTEEQRESLRRHLEMRRRPLPGGPPPGPGPGAGRRWDGGSAPDSASRRERDRPPDSTRVDRWRRGGGSQEPPE